MEKITQEFVDGLILAIEQAEEAESVSNLMVAYVLSFLRDKCLEVDSLDGRLSLESNYRQNADKQIQQELQVLRANIFTLAEDLKSSRNAFDTLVSGNASATIESFNEVIAFLDGLRDDESLAAILADHAGRLSELGLRLKSAQADANANASAIARHRQEAGVYRFDCVAADVYDIPAADRFEGMVAWDGIDRIFKECTDADANEWGLAGEDFTQENPDSHDNTDVTIPRSDRLFRSGKHLYHVAGSPEEGFRLVRYALVEEVEAVGKQLDTVRESTVDNYQLIKQEKKNREANCDALSDRISSGLSGVGIYPFAGFEDFGLGAGTDEEGEYAPGAVVFSTQTRCFLLKGADGSWQHAGAPYDVTDGGHFVPHTDCLYRLGQSLYRAVYSASDGWCLVRHLDEQDKLALHPRMTFSDDFNYSGTRLAMAEVTERDIEEWRAWSTVGGVVYGDFDRATRRWSLNGITDIDQDEHDMIMMLAPACRDNSLNNAIHTLGGRIVYKDLASTGLVRTLMPIIYNSAGGQTGSLSYEYFCNIEVLRFGENGFTSAGIKNCTKLREIHGLDLQRSSSGRTAIRNCPALVTFFGKRLNFDLDLSECPKLSMESVLYIINQRGGTGVITLTLHADVYAALTDEVIDAALKKNVSLAQA